MIHVLGSDSPNIVAECNYGGRVTDDKDVRLISSVLARFFTMDIACNDHAMLSSLDTYYIPKPGDIEDLKNYINTLPLEEDPRVQKC